MEPWDETEVLIGYSIGVFGWREDTWYQDIQFE